MSENPLTNALTEEARNTIHRDFERRGLELADEALQGAQDMTRGATRVKGIRRAIHNRLRALDGQPPVPFTAMSNRRVHAALAAVYNTSREVPDRLNTRETFIGVALQYGKHLKVTKEEIETVLDTPIAELLNLSPSETSDAEKKV